MGTARLGSAFATAAVPTVLCQGDAASRGGGCRSVASLASFTLQRGVDQMRRSLVPRRAARTASEIPVSGLSGKPDPPVAPEAQACANCGLAEQVPIVGIRPIGGKIRGFRPRARFQARGGGHGSPALTTPPNRRGGRRAPDCRSFASVAAAQFDWAPAGRGSPPPAGRRRTSPAKVRRYIAGAGRPLHGALAGVERKDRSAAPERRRKNPRRQSPEPAMATARAGDTLRRRSGVAIGQGFCAMTHAPDRRS